jgi:hypothetical protein
MSFEFETVSYNLQGAVYVNSFWLLGYPVASGAFSAV